jgi:hypothetical protein
MSLVVLIPSVQLGFTEGYANRRSASNPSYSAKLSTGADTLLRIRAPIRFIRTIKGRFVILEESRCNRDDEESGGDGIFHSTYSVQTIGVRDTEILTNL